MDWVSIDTEVLIWLPQDLLQCKNLLYLYRWRIYVLCWIIVERFFQCSHLIRRPFWKNKQLFIRDFLISCSLSHSHSLFSSRLYVILQLLSSQCCSLYTFYFRFVLALLTTIFLTVYGQGGSFIAFIYLCIFFNFPGTYSIMIIARQSFELFCSVYLKSMSIFDFSLCWTGTLFSITSNSSVVGSNPISRRFFANCPFIYNKSMHPHTVLRKCFDYVINALN